MNKKGWITTHSRWGTIIIAFLIFALSGCASKAIVWTEKFSTSTVEMPTSCNGWEKIEIKSRTRYYLAKEDQRLLVNIDAHNLRGRNLGCWN